jgi:hypothetical protein
MNSVEAHQAPSISLSKGDGSIRGPGEKSAAHPVNETGSITAPPVITSGRSAVGPQLTLSDDSGAGTGSFCFWLESFASQYYSQDSQRHPNIDMLKSGDVFILSGVEELVPILLPEGRRLADDASVPGYMHVEMTPICGP